MATKRECISQLLKNLFEKGMATCDMIGRKLDVELPMQKQGDLERQLIDAFGQVVHQVHPNPGRSGRPGIAVLTQLALHPENVDSPSTLAYVSHCAPCLDDLKRLRKVIK
jgi:hypothetical protein